MKPGQVLNGRYRGVRLIARGGMAEVWQGHDLLLDRRVALKVPLVHLGSDLEFRERFRREALAAARLTHPGIVAVYDTGTDGDDAYLVMELVAGPSLKDELDRSGRLGVAEAVRIAAEAAAALDYAHASGVVHRDVKPANVLLADAGQVKVADFGIAEAGFAGRLTGAGMTMGTAAYLSPEQARGEVPDARSDIYSLGAVLYEMLCGRPPFDAGSPVATALCHLREPVVPPRELNAEVPEWLESCVLATLAKAREDRLASAAELRALLLHRSAPTGAMRRTAALQAAMGTDMGTETTRLEVAGHAGAMPTGSGTAGWPAAVKGKPAPVGNAGKRRLPLVTALLLLLALVSAALLVARLERNANVLPGVVAGATVPAYPGPVTAGRAAVPGSISSG
ncbi:MAG: protein kinase domain-containing protein [Acidimicrobiales bacterium]